MATKPTRKAPAKPAAPIDPIFSAIAEHKRQAKESTRLYGELGLPRVKRQKNMVTGRTGLLHGAPIR